jgi:kynurenine formamidase
LEKGEWELVEPGDLEAGPEVRRGDIVIVNTGWHRRYADSQEYFGHGPGLSPAAAQWLVDRGAKLVGVDTATVDHPLATSLGPHRNGPLIKHLPARYEAKTGRAAKGDFPDWNPAHRLLLGAGIPTIENVGGDVDAVTGRRCTFHAYPWYWPEGDACIVRLVAILNPGGDYRMEPGE